MFPTHTPVTSVGVKPIVQESLQSLVVPVLTAVIWPPFRSSTVPNMGRCGGVVQDVRHQVRHLGGDDLLALGLRQLVDHPLLGRP